jgi:hypothetical protein
VVAKLCAHVRQNVVGYLALFVALGGTGALAATSLVGPAGKITGCVNKKTGTVRVVKPRAKCKRRERALAWNQQGSQGQPGSQGPQGETGTVDTSNFYDKAASDARFLGVGAKAADAEKLDGLDSSQLVQGTGSVWRHSQVRSPGDNDFQYIGAPSPFPGALGELVLGYTCPNPLTNNGNLRIRNTSAETLDVFTDNGSSNPLYFQLGPNAPFDQPAAPTGEQITFHTHSTSGRTWWIVVSSVHRASDCFWEFSAFLVT